MTRATRCPAEVRRALAPDSRHHAASGSRRAAGSRSRAVAGRRRTVALAAILFAAVVRLAAEDADALDRLFARPAAAPYRTQQATFTALVAKVSRAGVPPSVIIERIAEGIEKRVPAARLAASVAQDGDTAMSFSSAMASQYGEAAADASLVRLALAGARSRIATSLIFDLPAKARAAGRPSADIGSTIGTLVAIESHSELTAAEQAALADALFASRLPGSAFDAVASFFSAALVRRLSPESIVDIVVQTLRSGGGVIQMEQELSRRVR